MRPAPSRLPFLMLLAGATACASAPMPQLQAANSQSAIRAAEELGANDIPRAALHLQLAREQVAMAEKLIEHNQHERATAMLKRAESDAELALSMARTKPLHDSARSALEALEQVKQGASAQP